MKRTYKDLENHLKRVNNCGKKTLFFCDDTKSDHINLFNQSKYFFSPHKCNSYFCPVCVRNKKLKLFHNMKSVMKSDTWRFLTLTTSKKIFTTEQALKLINIDFNIFWTQIRRKFIGIKYIKILEISDNESVHFHILVNKYIPKNIIKHYWYLAHKSYVVDISKPAKLDNIINYVTKYFSKSIDNFKANEFFYLFRKRHFTTSRNFFAKVDKKKHISLLYGKPLNFDSLLFNLTNDIYNDNIDFYLIDFSHAPPDLYNIINNSLGILP